MEIFDYHCIKTCLFQCNSILDTDFKDIFSSFKGLIKRWKMNHTDNGFGVSEPSEHEHMVQLMLIVTEVAAAAEAYRKREGDDRIKEELADVIIRALDMAAYWGYDIDKAVRDKVEKNKTRGFRHGNRRV